MGTNFLYCWYRNGFLNTAPETQVTKDIYIYIYIYLSIYIYIFSSDLVKNLYVYIYIYVYIYKLGLVYKTLVQKKHHQ